MTENSHRQTLTIELDQNMDEFDQKYKNKIIQVRRLMFVGVNFLVMFTDFGLIHSVILNRSCYHFSKTGLVSKSNQITKIY